MDCVAAIPDQAAEDDYSVVVVVSGYTNEELGSE